MNRRISDEHIYYEHPDGPKTKLGITSEAIEMAVRFLEYTLASTEIALPDSILTAMYEQFYRAALDSLRPKPKVSGLTMSTIECDPSPQLSGWKKDVFQKSQKAIELSKEAGMFNDE